MQLQAAIANQQSKTAMFGAGLGLVGALFSDDRVKNNRVIVGWQRTLGVPIYMYEYTDEPGVQRFGLSAQDVLKVAPHLVFEAYDGTLMVAYGAV